MKVLANYNITKNVLDEFNKLAKEKAINKSGLIEILICEWIKQQKSIKC